MLWQRLTIEARLLASKLPRFDVYTVLERTARFATYPKDLAGVVAFFRQELYQQNVRYADNHFLVYQGEWLQLTPLEFCQLLLLPLYHCSWNAEMRQLLTDLESQRAGTTLQALTLALATALTVVVVDEATTGIKLEEIPEDWRDLAEDLIKSGNLELAKFKTLVELERYVDGFYLSEPPAGSDSPEINPEPEPVEAVLMEEEREVIARTFRLDPDDFTTKSEALRLYEARRGS